jgi:NAD(P)-dependent dehydrogenase (short-subunit alcohol dehydrogenase family)
MEHTATIVTGAGSGIGRATAIALARRGHALTLAGRTASKLAETAAACTAEGAPEPILVPGDLADSGIAHEVVDRTIAARGRLDVLVNCAGSAPLAPIDRSDEDIIEEAFLHNAFAPAFLIVRAWPHFTSRRAGCVVNVSSLASSDPFHGFFAYAAAKAAVDSFTRSMHGEGAKFGIRAFCINPGAIETPMLRKNFPEKVLPASRTLPPDAVAEVIVDCVEGRREQDRGKPIVVAK